jgi:DNA repair protein RadC
MPPTPGLREHYTVFGPSNLGETELLSLVLGTGSGGRSARAIASAMLDRFGTIERLRAAPVHSLADVVGVGPARAVRIHAALHLAQRADQQVPTGPVDHPHALVAFLRPHLESQPVETFWSVFLDARLHVVGLQLVSRGSLRCTVVDPAEVFRPAVAARCTAVAVAHNHPSGDPSPSAEDRALTRRLVQAGQVLGIGLVDHVIIAANGHWSFAEHHELPMSQDLRSFTHSPHRGSGVRPSVPRPA